MMKSLSLFLFNVPELCVCSWDTASFLWNVYMYVQVKFTVWHTISLYTGFPVLLKLCRPSKFKYSKKKRVVQSSPNVSHFIDSINNGQTQRKTIGNDCSPHLVWKPIMKMYLGAPLNKTGCSLWVLIHASHVWGEFSGDFESKPLEECC